MIRDNRRRLGCMGQQHPEGEARMRRIHHSVRDAPELHSTLGSTMTSVLIEGKSRSGVGYPDRTPGLPRDLRSKQCT